MVNNPAVNFFLQGPKRVVLNGPRPSPLRVNKDSHFIQKPSSATKLQQENPSLNQPRKQPVIIYTHSPKIIHTKPKDFMALVQKLTGFIRSDDRVVGNDEFHRDDQDPAILSTSFEEKESKKKKKKKKSSCASSSIHEHEDNDSSSVTSSDHEEGKYESGGIAAFEVSVPVNKASYLTDFPLFTPNSNNTLFTSPHQPILRYPDHMVFASPNVAAGSLSPSFVEFMKGLLGS